MENNINNFDKDLGEIKIESIKRMVEFQLDREGIYDKIKDFLDKEDDEEKLLEKLQEEGVIDEILNNFDGIGNGNDLNQIKNKINDAHKGTKKKCLYLKISKGKGFVDFSNRDDDTYFQFDVLFLGQRFISKKIIPSIDFFIDEIFVFDFNPLKLDIDLDLERLKKLSSPIHIVLLKINDKEKTLVASKSIEWRWVLCYGNWKIEAEMYSPATLNKLNVGSIEVYFIF
jgi:centrosomal protein CEP76